MRLTVLILLAMIFAVTGCGKKESSQPVPAMEIASEVPAELPELEQNKLYLNNPIVSGPQDTSFEPVPNEMEEVSQEELDLQGPPMD